MSKRIDIKDSFEYFSNDELISIIGRLLTIAENIAYSYDIEDEYCEEISQTFDDYDVDYEIIEEDI